MNDPTARTVRRVLAGRYSLESHLGSGGAGAVWRARDELLDRTVAVKVLHAEMANDPSTAARFRTEASMAAKLTHPNAVIVYDIGRDDDMDYLVMEFVEGGTLADVMRSGRMAPGVVAGMGSQVAGALGAAHRRRMVHRDVKPANVLITSEGVAKMADFGIAQALGAASAGLTMPGQVMGTARYLAPEQLRGEPIDARADVYALGVLLYEALTGDVPFGDGTAAEVASRRLVTSLPPVSDRRSDVPFALDQAIIRATRSDPAERFADGAEFASELSRAATPDAGRALAARLRQGGGRLPEDADESTRTADLPVVGPASRRDERTATMAATSAEPAPTSPPPSQEAGGAGPAGRRPRSRAVLAAGLLVAVLVVVGALVVGLERLEERPLPDDGEVAGGQPDSTEDEEQPDAADAGTPAEITDAGAHDPFGSGGEHAADVPKAYDDDAATAWQTQGYQGRADLGGLKPGVGIWFDLGTAEEIAQLELHMTPGAAFTVFTGTSPPAPDVGPEEWGEPVAEVAEADDRTELVLDEPTEARVWLVWFTTLPPDGSVFRATVSEIRLLRS